MVRVTEDLNDRSGMDLVGFLRGLMADGLKFSVDITLRNAEAVPVAVPEKAPERRFGLLLYSGHTALEMDTVMERLRIRCESGNSRALMRLLCELEKDGYVDLEDVKAAELYHELLQAFPMDGISQSSFAESFRLIG